MKRSKRKSLLQESVYQLFFLSFCFIVLVGAVVLHNGLQRYKDKQKYYLHEEYNRLAHIEQSKEAQDEIKNIYNYLSYEYNYNFDHSNTLLQEQVSIVEQFIKETANSQEDIDKFVQQFLSKHTYPITYSITKEILPQKDKDDIIKYVPMKNNEYLKIAFDNTHYNIAKTSYILNNIEKFRIGKKGEFYSKVLPQEEVAKKDCQFYNDGTTAHYKCVDDLWNIEFGAYYDVGSMYKKLAQRERQIEKEIMQQILIVIMIILLGAVAIVVFIKNKEKTIQENVKYINQSIDALDGNLTSLKLNLNSNIKYEEFKFLNLALNKFIARMKKTQELIADKNKEILKKAYYDSVTGLKNTTKLLIDLKKYRHNDKDSMLVVFFIDLDKFRQVNESKGRDVGDEILCTISKRLLDMVDLKKDHVSRVAADEFVIAKEFSKTTSKEEIEKFAHEILLSIGKPITIDEDKFYFTASIGIETHKEEYDCNCEELIGSADSAMSVAKKKGVGKIEFYDKIIDDRRKEYLKIQKNLRLALKENEFRLFFQPKVDVKTGKIVGAEALIRWIKNGEIIPPGYFIEVAESSNLIVDIGKWVINEGFRVLKSWIDKGEYIKISMNLSVKQLKSETLMDDIKNAFERYPIPPELIDFEITENFAIQNSENIGKLNELKSLGVKLSIDDFGTGYSSLSYLNDLPFDVVKIDMSFVLNMSKDLKKQALVDAIIQMSKTLDKKTIAEGVEFEDDLGLLKQFGCDEFQGYYFSKPLPEHDFYELLKNQE